MVQPIRVLIADDHALLRAGVRSLLSGISDIEIIGEASDGREALELVASLHPHVMLMDIAMPNMNGLMAAERIRSEFPNVRVIILSMHATEDYVTQAIRAGAAGYLLKDAQTAELEFAVKAVARGETYLTPVVSKQVMTSYLQMAGTSENGSGPLTPRQREILQLIAEGNTTKQIAATLKISVKTVETHRTQLMERLDIHDIPGLVRYAMRTGLVSPEM